MLVAKLGNITTREKFASSDKVFPKSPAHPQYQQLSRSELLRDNGAYARLGRFIARRFRQGATIRYDAASNGNQRYDVALGIVQERVGTIAKVLGVKPEVLLTSSHPKFIEQVTSALKVVGSRFPMFATERDPLQVQSGQNGPVFYSEEQQRAEKLGVGNFYNCFIQLPALKSSVGNLTQGDAFEVKTPAPVDVLVTSNWLGHLATTIDTNQRTPEERRHDIGRVQKYLSSVADQINPKGILALGCVDLSWDVPKLLPTGKFKPVTEPGLIMRYSPLSRALATREGMIRYYQTITSGKPVEQKEAPFVFERVSG